MVMTQSRKLALGTAAPDFSLPDPAGMIHNLGDFAGSRALVVAFICNHCPYVKHIVGGLAQFAHDYRPRDVAMVAISSNDASRYTEDSPPNMAKLAAQNGFDFPYLVRCIAGGGESLSGGVHARPVPVRPGATAGLSRAVRCQPAGQQAAGDRCGSARRRRCGARRAGRSGSRLRASAAASNGNRDRNPTGPERAGKLRRAARGGTRSGRGGGRAGRYRGAGRRILRRPARRRPGRYSLCAPGPGCAPHRRR